MPLIWRSNMNFDRELNLTYYHPVNSTGINQDL